jgi:hypothetical protein
MRKDAWWNFSSCRRRDPKRYMGNLVESLEKLLLVSPRSSVSAGASKTATFHLVTNLGLADSAGTLERSYLSFSAKSHSLLHVFSRKGLQQASISSKRFADAICEWENSHEFGCLKTSVLEIKQNGPLMRGCDYAHWKTSKARTSGTSWLGRRFDSTPIMIRRQCLHGREMKSFQECDRR